MKKNIRLNTLAVIVLILSGLLSNQIFAQNTSPMTGSMSTTLSHFTPVSPTGRTQPVYITDAELDGVQLQSGDEIGVFDGSLCVGAAEVSTFPMSNPIVVHLEYTPPGEDPLPGAHDGNSMSFKVWDQSANRQEGASATVVTGSAVFSEGSIVAVSLSAGTPPVEVEITVTTDPAGRNFTVDGTPYTSAQTFTWIENSTYTISVTSPQSGGAGTRYVYTSWSDGGAQSHTYTVPGSDETVTANFTTQYELIVNSAHGSPTGAGWYDAGAGATFGVTTPEAGGAGTRYVFTGWTGTGAGSYSGTDASKTVTMNNTITEDASWKTQYELNVNSAHGSPTGTGWYDAGDDATFGVTTPEAGGAGTRYVFTGWTGTGAGSYTGTDASKTVTMNNTITEDASWKTQYYLSTAENPDSGGDITPAPPGLWYDRGTDASVDATVASGYQWAGWSGDLSGTNRPATVNMDAPKTVTANFGKEVEITVTTDPAGRNFTVDGTPYTSAQTFTWIENSTYTISVTSPQSGGAGTRYVYTSWSDGGAQSHTYTVPGSDETVTANFTTQYELIVNSAHGSPTGAGWYDAGAGATFGVTTPEAGGAGTRYVFTGWTGTGAGSYSGTDASKTVTMNNTITEDASWKTQYELNVNSAHGSPTGTGWYDAGDDATFGVTTPEAGGAGTRYVFTGWTGTGAGSYTGTDASKTVTMNNTITEDASWKTQYYLSTAENPDSGGDITPAPPGLWYDRGTDASVDATVASGYQWAGWSGDLSGTNRPATVNMDAPKTVTANFGKEVEITVTTDPAGRNFTVDGTPYTSAQTFTWIENSTYTISVTSPQSGGAGTRYVYTSWSDGGAQSHTYTVPGSDETVTANFTTQYELIVNSAHGSPTGAGWYNAGTNANFSVTSPDVQGTTRYVFLNWSGDFTGSNTSGSVTMDNPMSVTASWKTQYILNVISGHGNPQGAGWYDNGATANFSVTSPDVQGSTRYLFSHWSGDYSGTENSGSLLMTSAKNVTANWDTQHYLSTSENPDEGGDMTPAPPGGWYNEGSVVSLNATPNSGADYIFGGWSGDLSGMDNPASITMDSPKSVSANFTVTGQIRVTTNPEGLKMSVDGTEYTSPHDFTWSSGSTHTIGVASPQSGGSDTRYVYQSWSDGGDQVHDITINGMSVYTAEFRTQYYLTTSENPDEGGDMSPSPPGGWYNSGSSVSIEAIAASGYGFSGWSGDLTGTTNPDNIIISRPKSVTASFIVADNDSPILTNCYPPSGSLEIPKNSDIQFTIIDKNDGYGVDDETIDVSVNGIAIILYGLVQPGYDVTITSHSHSYTIHYNPTDDFIEGSTVTIQALADDLYSPANSMDSTYSFTTGQSSVTETALDTIDQNGGVITDDSTGIVLSIPAGALEDTTEITIGVIENPPALPDTVDQIGLTIHFGPDGLQFADSVVISIPYTQEDLDSVGVSDPLDLPIYYFSTTKGTWTKLFIFSCNDDFVYVKIKEFCYLVFSSILTTGVEEREVDMILPSDFVLMQNYPNPFNPNTVIRYQIPEKGRVVIEVYNMMGRKVRKLVDDLKTTGTYEVVWDGCDENGQIVSSGMYLYVMKSHGYMKMMKALFMK